MSESVLPMFSSKSFIVSGLMFRSLIHFEFIVCMVLESVEKSFSALSLLGWILPLCGAALCTTGCLAAPLAPPH